MALAWVSNPLVGAAAIAVIGVGVVQRARGGVLVPDGAYPWLVGVLALLVAGVPDVWHRVIRPFGETAEQCSPGILRRYGLASPDRVFYSFGSIRRLLSLCRDPQLLGDSRTAEQTRFVRSVARSEMVSLTLVAVAVFIGVVGFAFAALSPG